MCYSRKRRQNEIIQIGIKSLKYQVNAFVISLSLVRNKRLLNMYYQDKWQWHQTVNLFLLNPRLK